MKDTDIIINFVNEKALKLKATYMQQLEIKDFLLSERKKMLKLEIGGLTHYINKRNVTNVVIGNFYGL